MTKLKLAWIVSLIATLGSLYFSEIRQFVPCELCWFQRILMYPLVLLLGISIYRRDVKIKFYVLPFSVIGIGISGYHYLLQKLEWLRGFGQCSGVSCHTVYINWFGFITIPFLAFVAFVLITILIIRIKTKE